MFCNTLLCTIPSNTAATSSWRWASNKNTEHLELKLQVYIYMYMCNYTFWEQIYTVYSNHFYMHVAGKFGKLPRYALSENK